MTRALGVVLLLTAAPAFADLFSPGELAKPHEKLEGLENCTKCHPAGQQLSQASCVACHKELEPRLSKGLGLHGRITSADRNCERCHTEHRGRSASIIAWGTGGQKGFNHVRTGWALHGAHLKLECSKCHEKRRITGQAALALLERAPAQETFLGLPQTCNSCHFDEHRGQVGAQCEGCHDEKAWKPAPGFDHGQTDYALTGKHAQVACEKCHPKLHDEQPKGFPAPKHEMYLKYAPIESATCLDCHKDPHENRFGPRCSSCHSTQGWTVIRNASQERAFHEKTRYPLKGEHLEVACTSCHGPWPGQKAKFKGLEFDQCSDCHPDAHVGQLNVGKKGPECEKCHVVDGFSPPRFGLTQHRDTRFVLEGAHQTVGCLNCHTRSAALEARIPPAVRLELKKKKRPELFSFTTLDFKVPLDKCDSCHADAHHGQLKDKPCATCHQASSFSQLTFDHAKDSRWPLTDKHEQVACDKCHAPEKKGGAVKYRGLPQACSGCHADVHAGQLAVRGETQCERCHETKGFKPSKFEHQPPFTAFLLEGKHLEAKCEACHVKVKLKGELTAVRYKPLQKTCEGCHSDFHQGAFKGFEP